MSPVLPQFIKFAGVGVIGTLAHYLVLILSVELFDADTVLASSLGALAGAIVNYILNYRFTFQSNKQHSEAFIKFLLVAGIGFAFNGLLMGLFTRVLNWFYLFAQVITTLLVLVWNFIGNRLWTFAHPPLK